MNNEGVAKVRAEEMGSRKIIQITAVRTHGDTDSILALCDDGTVWYSMGVNAAVWTKMHAKLPSEQP